MAAASLVQLGGAHEELAERTAARHCYEEALKVDGYCYEVRFVVIVLLFFFVCCSKLTLAHANLS